MKTALCFSADFETTTDKEDCRVWAYALSNVANPHDFRYGNSIQSFLEFCANPKFNYTMYFFNLKFDGAFIIAELLKQGYTRIESPKERADKTFTTLITDRGAFYAIEIFFEVKKHHTNKVKIIDAMKIFPNFSVERLAESFGLPISKLELDYKAKREIGHQLTDEEIANIRNDVENVAWALKAMFEKGLTRMTIASNAMNDFKSRCSTFKTLFPEIDPDKDVNIRASYRGGFTYLNEIHAGKIRQSGVTLDVNSLYPSIMKFMPMPIGDPIEYEGEYQPDEVYPLYVQIITCVFELKDGKIPCVQIKHSMNFMPNEYLKSSGGDFVTLTLTKPDLELFLEQYKIIGKIIYERGWKFRSANHVFDSYIDYWTEEKITAGKEGNKGKRQIAKLMLNSLY